MNKACTRTGRVPDQSCFHGKPSPGHKETTEEQSADLRHTQAGCERTKDCNVNGTHDSVADLGAELGLLTRFSGANGYVVISMAVYEATC